jgi:hypothetical protein
LRNPSRFRASQSDGFRKSSTHPAGCLIDGGHRAKAPLPTYRFCPSGKSLKICPALPRKIFRFPRRANHLYKLAPSRSEKRGVGHRHERWDGMRWTRQRRARDCGRRAVLRERSCSARTNGASTPPPRLRPAARGRFRDWWRLLRTAKPCGPGTRCWCQAGGGCSNPTGFRSTVNSLATVTRRIRRRGEHGISR